MILTICLQRCLEYLTSLSCLLFLVMASFSISFAQGVNYIYDSNGRLFSVVNGTNAVIYQYDKAGNLLSTTQGTTDPGIPAQAAPILTGITPDMIFPGAAFSVTFSGSNLLTTKSITANNSAIGITVESVSDTDVQTVITVPVNVQPGAVSFTLTTLYGSASIGATVATTSLTLTPGAMNLPLGTSGSIAVSLTPPTGQATTLSLSNSNPTIASAPSSVTIPASGAGQFSVTAVSQGDTTITSGNASISIFVLNDMSAVSASVSVYMDPSQNKSATRTSPVSVYLDPTGGASVRAPSVSVYRDASSLVGVVLSSVSVYVDAPGQGATTVSPKVSVEKNRN